MARASRLDPVNLPSSGTTGYRSISRTLSMMAWVLVLVRSCSILSTTRSPAHPCEDGGHRSLQRVVALRGHEIFGASSGRQRDGEETTKDARLRFERVNVADLVIELLLNGSSTSLTEGNDRCATARGPLSRETAEYIGHHVPGPALRQGQRRAGSRAAPRGPSCTRPRPRCWRPPPPPGNPDPLPPGH